MENSLLHSSASPSLPNDLLFRILAFLPLQSLFRLRSVCRLWRSLPFCLLFVDFGTPSPSSPLVLPDAHHRWFLAFRLLARKVNEWRSSTYKCTTYSYEIAYDREMLDSCGLAPLPAEKSFDKLRASEHAPQTQKIYEILSASSPLVTHFETGVLDIAASAGGLLLLTVRPKESQNHEDSNLRLMARVRAAQNHEDSNLKLFVYNPISKDLRALPATQWGSQKLSMVICEAEGPDQKSGYKIYSLGRHYRPGTTNLLYSFEVYDSTQAASGWQFLSHVSANLSGSGDLHPGKATQIMGYVNSKSIYCKELGFLYWMPCLEHQAETGRHTELSSCYLNKGCFYCLPGLPFKTTFAHMWLNASGLGLVCGVAKGDSLSVTHAVEIWALHQGEEDPRQDEEYYGGRSPPLGTQWQPIDKLPHDLLDRLTHGLCRRIACAVASPLVFVIAEDEEEKMVVYNVKDRVWKLQPSWAILHKLFLDKPPHPQYYQVFPWIVSFTPNPSTLA